MNRIAASADGRTGLAARLTLGVAALALVVGVPSAGFAVGLLDDGAVLRATQGNTAFTPASADPRVAQIVAQRSDGKARFMRFTPGGSQEGSSRSLTVAVRIDEEAAQAISVRSAIEAADGARSAAASLRIAPTRFNLGLARGYQSFARAQSAAPELSASISGAAIPDLSEFRPSAGVRQEPSRFAARVKVEDDTIAERPARITPPAGHATEQTLELGGSYRLTRNLDVTAGVRYSHERDPITALPDIEEQDSQAVYIGTQFRF